MNRGVIEDLRAGALAIRRAEEDLHYKMTAAFPIGAAVTWKRGNYVQDGIVTAHRPIGKGLEARNIRTTSIHRVSAFEILLGAGIDGKSL